MGSFDDGNSLLLSPPTQKPIEHQRSQEIQRRREDRRVLLLTYTVLFSRYAIATFLSAFFPTYAEDTKISGTFSGLIFAAYPFGITLTSAFGTGWMRRLGLKACVLIGMLNTALFTFLFGATPAICKHLHADESLQKWLFLVFYFLGGLGGAVAETACIMMANYRFRENSGAISASIGTVCGIGCMVGPPIGGVLYDYGQYTGMGSFFFPFFVFSAIPFIITSLLPCTVSDTRPAAQDERAASLSEVMTKSRLVTLISMGLNGALVASLDPTLAYRLKNKPFQYSSTLVGLAFMASSVSFSLVSIPAGYLLDNYPDNSALFKAVQGMGFMSLGLCFTALGPIQIRGSHEIFNNIPTVWAAMLLKGLGSVGCNACYPDLVVGVPEKNERVHARISGLWNAVYAIGWAIGPMIGGSVYQTLGFAGFATISASMAFCSMGTLYFCALPSVSSYLNKYLERQRGISFERLESDIHAHGLDIKPDDQSSLLDQSTLDAKLEDDVDF